MKVGDFVRVKEDHESFHRKGKDGMVVDTTTGPDCVALFFGTDRHNEFQDVECVGPELWQLNELDLSTIDCA